MIMINASLSDSQINEAINKAEDLPKYTEYCKFVLIEELTLEQDYRYLHHGKCSVIGKVGRCNKNGYILGNVKIPHLPSEYNVPEDSLRVQLDLSNCSNIQLQVGHYYEVVGEVILKAIEKKAKEPNCLTARSVSEQLLVLSDAEDREKLLHYFYETYKPSIKIWFANSILMPSELVARNLELRLIQEKIEEFHVKKNEE